jgi:hypothetical protein
MSFIQLNGMNELQEPELAPEAEYALMIVDVDAYTKDTGRDIVKVRITFEDHDEYADFNSWLALPNVKIDVANHPEGEEAGQKKFKNMMLNVKRFLAQWGIDSDEGFDPADLQGARAICPVTQEDNDDGRTFQRLITPRIK